MIKKFLKLLMIVTVFFINIILYGNVSALEVFEYEVEDREDIYKLVFSQGLLLFQDNNTRLFGYKNAQGEVIIDPVFESAAPFSEGLASVWRGQWSDANTEASPMTKSSIRGHINTEGKYVFPPQYHHSGSFKNGKAVVSNKDGYFVIDKSGNRLTDYYNYIHDEPDMPLYKITAEDSGCGYMNENLEIVLPMDYNPDIKCFGDRYFVVTKAENEDRYVIDVESGKKIELTKDGYSIDNVYQIFEGRVAVYNSKNGYTILDFDGNTIFHSLTELILLKDGYILQRDYIDEGEYGTSSSIIIKPDSSTFNSKGVVLFPFDKYLIGNLEVYIDEYLSYKHDYITAFYDYDGNVVMGDEYDYYIPSVDRIYGIKGDTTTIFDLDFNVLVSADIIVSADNTWRYKFVLNNIEPILTPIALIFEKDGLKGICDVDLNVLIDARYELLSGPVYGSGIGVEKYSVSTPEQHNTANKLIFVYDERGELPEVIEQYYPVTEAIEMETFRLEIGKPTVETANGTVFIDPNNHKVAPILENGRTLVPMRFITEQIHGAEVSWNDYERKAIFTVPGRSIMIWPDKTSVEYKIFNEITRVFDEFNYTLEVTAQLINSRTFVPLRVVSELLGLSVNYDEDTGIITIGNNEAE